METTLCHLKPLMDKESPHKYFQIILQAAQKRTFRVRFIVMTSTVFKKLRIRKRPESPDSSSANDFWKGRLFVGAKTEQTLGFLAYLARCGHGEKQRTRWSHKRFSWNLRTTIKRLWQLRAGLSPDRRWFCGVHVGSLWVNFSLCYFQYLNRNVCFYTPSRELRNKAIEMRLNADFQF